MDIIQHKSSGPVAALRSSYKRLMGVMTVVPIAIFLTNLPNADAMLSSLLFWTYIAFCAGVFLFARLSLSAVRKLERTEEAVKDHLEQQVSVLALRLRQKIVFQKATLLVLIALTEITPYFQHYTMLAKWHSLPVLLRVATYATLFLLQHFAVRRVAQAKYGQHIQRLQQIVEDMRS